MKLIPLIGSILLILSIDVSGQQTTLPLGIFYQGEIYQVDINPPKGWKFDLENPRIDGRSAACYPADQEYYNNKAMIVVWIYKLDSLSFRDFISRDSISYLKKSSSLQFKKKDSLKTAEERNVFVLETSDPGGKSSMASVAYIDVGTEILIFELNIAGRMEYAEGQVRLMEMVSGIQMQKRDL